MIHDTLISADKLADLMTSGGRHLRLLDCSFELARPDAGRAVYESGHLPGARYVHLDHVLSARRTGSQGRHPLPSREAFAASMSELGVGDDTQVVAYDNAFGAYAARLWWMLRWAGHEAVAVLDGGLAAWKARGGATGTGSVRESPSAASAPAPRFTLRPSLVTTASYEELGANLDSRARLVVDARAPDRFRGENETLDPIGGHIPGAVNRFFRDNLDADGRFKTPAQLREEFESITHGRAAIDTVHQCGSGVTACHNLLAMEVAGLAGAALYPGSWSEWSAQPGAPIATGAGQ